VPVRYPRQARLFDAFAAPLLALLAEARAAAADAAATESTASPEAVARGCLGLLRAAHALRSRVGALHGALRAALRVEARQALAAAAAAAAADRPGGAPRTAAQQAAARQVLASLDAEGGNGGGGVAPLAARMGEVRRPRLELARAHHCPSRHDLPSPR